MSGSLIGLKGLDKLGKVAKASKAAKKVKGLEKLSKVDDVANVDGVYKSLLEEMSAEEALAKVESKIALSKVNGNEILELRKNVFSKFDDVSKSGIEGVNKARPYAHLQDSKSVGPGKDFTAAQKRNIIQENMKNNGGVVKSDSSGEVLVKPSKSQRGVTPPQNEWQIDHIVPKDKGGLNSYSNAQVLSRKENREKSNK